MNTSYFFVVVEACSSVMLINLLYYAVTKLLELNFIDFVIWELCCKFYGQVLVLAFHICGTNLSCVSIFRDHRISYQTHVVNVFYTL